MKFRSSLTLLVFALILAVMATVASVAMTAQHPEDVSGTWGLPPVDGQPGVSGSYFNVYREGVGNPRAELSLNPSGWDCTLHAQEIVWNAGKARFEWPDRSVKGNGDSCWLTVMPQSNSLLLTIQCPYQCTEPKVHTITLEHIADARLIPPIQTVHTFCSSHDVLRQQFCLPGAIQDGVARLNRTASQVGVLAEDKSQSWFDVKKTMLEILATCHARGGDRSCLQQALDSRVKELETVVAGRQKKLADERRASELAAVSLMRTDQQKAWEGTWAMVNDEMVSTLTIGNCGQQHCTMSVDGETNYEWGYAHNRGACMLDEEEMHYLDANHGFTYHEPYEDDANANGAGPFANFCRIDLTRLGDGYRLSLRGAGCQLTCGMYSSDVYRLNGDYHPLQTPSFACNPETDTTYWDEEIICRDPELARLDREMASAFEKVRVSMTGASRDQFVRSQRNWIQSRREACDSDARRTCLVQAYQKRLAELRVR